jgi:hypothetical protein
MKAIFNPMMGVFALAFSVVSITAWAADPIVGTWRLLSWSEEETESTVVHKSFGDNPSGLTIYTADGHMIVILSDPSRKSPAAPRATDAEAAQLYRTMIAFGGRYKTDGDKLILYPEVSWNQTLNGTEQTRFFEVKGDRFQIKTPALVSAISGKQTVATIVYERVK